MPLKQLRRNLELLQQAITYLKNKNIQPKKLEATNFASFQNQQEAYYQKNYFAALRTVQKAVEQLDRYDEKTILMEKEVQKFSHDNLDHNIQIIANIYDLLEEIEAVQKAQDNQEGKSQNQSLQKAESLIFQLPSNIPEEIKEEVQADMQELEKCYRNDCFRSSIILCGRLLETALHRKYFDTTAVDILETNPGIGLGTLIAKLKEKGVQFDPGITQQIHLINQVRIFSVHKKPETFHPSSNQAQAMILYTLDTLQKLF